MLNKLMKYDLKWIYKAVVVFYCLALIFLVIAFALGRIENSVLFNILSEVSNGFALSMVISALINCIMRSWARFVQNIYKDEAYLTHTLPISKGTIYSSKILSSIICTFTTTAISALCIVFYFYNNKAISEQFKNVLKTTAGTLNTSVYWLMLIIFAVFALETVFILFTGYAGIIIGHKSNKGKMIKSIISGFTVYMAANILSVGIICISGLFNDNISYIITANEIVNPETLKIIMLIFIAVYFIYDIALYFSGRQLLKKGVNID